MDRGDVVRVDLPPPSGKPGREQIGERPAIVVQVREATAKLPTVTVIPFTSKTHNLRHFGAVPISAAPGNGLDMDSVALVHQIRAIDSRRITRIVGRLSSDDMLRIDAGIRQVLGV